MLDSHSQNQINLTAIERITLNTEATVVQHIITGGITNCAIEEIDSKINTLNAS